MADDGTPLPAPLDDAFEKRDHEIVRQQGIGEYDYTELLELAEAHAEATPNLPGAQPWRFIGPRNVGGRIVSLDQDPTDPRIIYAGSAHGGLWRSPNGGDTWTRIGDPNQVYPVGAVGVAAGAPDVVYFGTGSLKPIYVSGRGLFRATITRATGATVVERLVQPDSPAVAPVNATPGAALRYTRIRVDPHDPTRFWAASQTGLWRCECPLAQPARPQFTRDFPDRDNKPTVAQLVGVPGTNGLWPSHASDLLVARDPRETDTVPLNGSDVPRYLILYVAVDSVGVFRGRFDRKDATISFESAPLPIPFGDRAITRVRLSQCERLPNNVVVIAAQNRAVAPSKAGSLLTRAVDSSGTVIRGQYHATNAVDGTSPALTTLLRSGDNIVVIPNPLPALPAAQSETVRVFSVLNDTDVVMTTPFSTAFPVGGLVYGRDTDSNSATEVFRTSDNGDNWTTGAQPMKAIGVLTGQADYDLVLEMSPADPSIIIGGEGEICLSRDNGNSWTKILDWLAYDNGDKAQHADQHIAMFDRGDNRRVWIGNDGGLSLARDLRMPVQADGYWRKRSHGIYAGEAQDISVNPLLPFMCGAGFQDNGTFLSLGGPTWYHVGGADGGAMAFNLPSARQCFVTWQGSGGAFGLEQVDAVASDLPMSATPNAWYDLVTVAAGDIPDAIARGHRIRNRWTSLTAAIAAPPTFVGIVEQHPALAGLLLLGRIGDGFASTNGGATWAQLRPLPAPNGTPIAPGANEEVSAMAFGPVDAKNPVGGAVDGWAGTNLGNLFFTNNAPGGTWNPATTPPFPGGALGIGEIHIHPRDRRIIAIAAVGVHGRAFLSYTQGRTWIDVTEPAPTSVSVTPAAASVGIGQKIPFTAKATYGAKVVNVTWRANWLSNNTVAADVDTAFGTNAAYSGLSSAGQVTGNAVGTPDISATLIAGVGAATAKQKVTVTAAAQPAAPLTVQPAEMVPGSLPPGPIPSVIFDPSVAAGAPATLLAGTIAGVYALPNVPVVQSLTIEPAGPLTFQNTAAPFQLRCVATFTDGTKVDVTQDVDWSSSTTAAATVSNAAPQGQVTFAGVGNTTISADRGGVAAATVVVNVQTPVAAAPVMPAAPGATNPTVTVGWQRYSVGLPRVLINDFERVGSTTVIRAATMGLGLFECTTSGGPAQQLYIAQTVIDDGRSARTLPAGITDDPRLPAAAVALDMTHAFGIRLDAPPYSFFDDVVDGVEMDEQLEVGDAVPTEDNFVYVQVHNIGTSNMVGATVHLYAAECAAADVINPIGPAATPSPASLDAGAPISDFYGQANRDPIGASTWKRIGKSKPTDVPSDAPTVVRFTWTPDAALAGKNVALLALCEGPGDALQAAPKGAALSAFIVAEPHAALRVVHVAARPTASLYIRDGVADDTRLGGYPVAGRSPDIMVVHPDISVAPDVAFNDFVSRRPADTLSKAATNIVYVRVHNRRRFETKAKVKIFAVPLDDSSAPNTSTAAWTELPAGAAFADVTIPASDVGYARIELPTPGDPNATGTNKAYLLVALVKSEDDTDPLPNKDRVDSVDAFWDLVSRYVDSDNAAGRAIPWVAA